MRKLFFSTIFLSLIFLSSLTSSCVKETIREITRDTTIIIRDTTIIKDTTIIQKDTTIIRSPSNQELVGGKWNTIHHEFETYLGTVMSSKKVENGYINDLAHQESDYAACNDPHPLPENS